MGDLLKMVSLNFLGYRVLNFKYERKLDKNIKQGEKIQLEPRIGIHVSYNETTKIATVKMSLDKLEKLPFDLKVMIEGKFEFMYSTDKIPENYMDLLRSNAAAILFPYLRSTVSQLTLLSGEYSPLVLPTIDVRTLMNSKN